MGEVDELDLQLEGVDGYLIDMHVDWGDYIFMVHEEILEHILLLLLEFMFHDAILETDIELHQAVDDLTIYEETHLWHDHLDILDMGTHGGWCPLPDHQS